MDWIFLGLLFLHVMGAIMAFGPPFAFAFFGPMAAREPQHVNFTIRLQDRISKGLILPLALFQGVTGVGLLWKGDWVYLQRGWLLLAVALYVIALANALFNLTPTARKLIDATSGPPPPRPETPAGAPAAVQGPPPHIAALVRRARMSAMVNLVLIVVIVFLMVTKPF